VKHIVKFLAAAAAIAVAGTASAVTPVDITSYSFSGLSGFNISGTVVTETVSAGEIGITSDIGSFLTYCIDITHALDVSKAYFLDQTYTNDLIARLFNVSGFEGAGVGSASDKAALQLAIWEAVYDPAPGSLTTGNFIVAGTDAATNAAVIQASVFLAAADALPVNSYRTELWAFVSPGVGNDASQDLVTTVPEPGTYALMLAGLAGIGFVARRRSASRD